MPKHAIRIPALRAGRRVRWMFEVFADVGEGLVRTPKTAKKHVRSKPKKKASRVRTSRRKSLVAQAVLSPSTVASSTPMMSHAERVRPETARAITPMPPEPSRANGREVFGAVAIGVVLVIGVAIALGGYPAPQVASAARTPSEAPSARPEPRPQPVHFPAPVVHEPVASAVVPKAVAAKSRETPAVTTKWSAPDPVPSVPVVKAAAFVGPTVPDTVVTERASASAVASKTEAANRAVTINGCLEMTVDEDQFRLSDTDGADAPKARSWKSGFLKKGSAPVELLEFSDAPTLRSYVGHRVVATGLLSGRQLRVRSVQATGSSCD
jgi:hypothetical protein